GIEQRLADTVRPLRRRPRREVPLGRRRRRARLERQRPLAAQAAEQQAVTLFDAGVAEELAAAVALKTSGRLRMGGTEGSGPGHRLTSTRADFAERELWHAPGCKKGRERRLHPSPPTLPP